MTAYKQAAVVLVDFGFADGTGSKKRPALVVSSDRYQASRREVVVAAITSNTQRLLFGDTTVDQWREAGLLFPSAVTGIVRTIQAGLILRQLGMLSGQDFDTVRQCLKETLGL